ncbi:MAG: AAA family ATPase [Actinomycetes bacterium]
MIIWLNGPFGGGKTTAAEALQPLIPNSRIFDPESVGYMLRANFSDIPVDDFQDWPAWRPLVAAALAEVSRQTGAHLIAPQSVLHSAYLTEIFARLHGHGLPTFHVLLDADDATMRQRIRGNNRAEPWRLRRLETYARSRSWLHEAADLVIDTTRALPADVAREIAEGLKHMSGTCFERFS